MSDNNIYTPPQSIKLDIYTYTFKDYLVNNFFSYRCQNRKKCKVTIKISKEAINPENPSSVSEDNIEMLEDLITAAINQTSTKAQKIMEEKMKAVTGGISIPGLF